MITINNLDEMKKFFDKKTYTYGFNDDVEFNFDLKIQANISAYNVVAWDIEAWDIYVENINACNIKAHNIYIGNINAWDIEARDIIAGNINAKHISYKVVCCADNNIVCETINGSHPNSKHFVLDGKLEVKNS